MASEIVGSDHSPKLTGVQAVVSSLGSPRHSAVMRMQVADTAGCKCDHGSMMLTSYVLLWPHPGMEDALTAYEDVVLPLVVEHGGSVLQRARSHGDLSQPLEIQLFEWPSQEAMDSYMADPRRTALSDDRERAIARTEIVPVQLI